MTTNSTTKSTAITNLSFDSATNQVFFTFVSNPTKIYPYTVAEGKFQSVVESFSTTTSLGSVYHELVKTSVIAPTV